MIGALSWVFIISFVLLFACIPVEITKGVYRLYIHWNEPVYLVYRAYDPVFGHMYDIPSSPARLEPNGKPQLEYFTLLKEYQVREWGLNPDRMIPWAE